MIWILRRVGQGPHRGEEGGPAGCPPGAEAWFMAAAVVVVRPYLWVTAMSQLRRLASPGWWRRWPHLPTPDPEYLRFRLKTAYGDPRARPAPADVVAYLQWCRALRRLH